MKKTKILITLLFTISILLFVSNSNAEDVVITENLKVDGKVAIGAEPVSSSYYLRVEDLAINTSSKKYGITNILKKTAGASNYGDTYVGINNSISIDQAGGEIGYAYGLINSSRLYNGTIGNAVSGVRHMYGLHNQAFVAGGTVTGTVYGQYSRANLDAGTVNGNVFGIYNIVDQESGMNINGKTYGIYTYMDLDGNHSGTSYSVYISQGNGVDYGIYQSGTAPNYFNGNVGIGTTTPDYKLDVLGTIRAEEVKVETGWSDFVFEEDYALPSLNQVESYIKENKHLPDIPSAKEVGEDGLSVAEMMAKQMQKIEELTLYVIKQNKELASLKKENEEIKQKLERLVN